MKNSAKLTFATLVLASVAATCQHTSAAVAGIASGKWFFTRGTGVIKAKDFANFTLGDGSQDHASDQAIAASFTSGSLKQAGDSITLSGSVSFTGARSSANQFRFGIFDENGQSNNSGWLGYFLSNSNDSSAGMLYERNKPNTSDPLSVLKDGAALETPVATGNAAFKLEKPYQFKLSYTRLSNGSLEISYSLTSGTNYALSGVINDPTPQTYTFNRISFLSGGDMRADQLKFNNVEIAFKRGR